mgnify:CR=1 FL=1
MKKRLGYLNKRETEVIGSFAKELKDKLGDEILSIRLFGSKVRGDFYQDSDIDIFILIKEKKKSVIEELDEIAANYVLHYDLPLSPVVYDIFEYKKNKELGSFFFESVEREGILL